MNAQQNYTKSEGKAAIDKTSIAEPTIPALSQDEMAKARLDSKKRFEHLLDSNKALRERFEVISKNGLSKENALPIIQAYNQSGDISILIALFANAKNKDHISHLLTGIKYHGTEGEFQLINSMLSNEDEAIRIAAVSVLPQFKDSTLSAKVTELAIYLYKNSAVNEPTGLIDFEKLKMQSASLDALAKMNNLQSREYLKSCLMSASDKAERIRIMRFIWYNDKDLFESLKSDPLIKDIKDFDFTKVL